MSVSVIEIDDGEEKSFIEKLSFSEEIFFKDAE